MRGIWGGGLNIFFRGRNSHQVKKKNTGRKRSFIERALQFHHRKATAKIPAGIGNPTRLTLRKTLIFLSLLFWKKQGKPPKKARIFLYAEFLESLGKKGKTLKKARKFLATKKARKSKKARKGRSGNKVKNCSQNNKLKTTPTPNKNGSYGLKWGGFVCHIFGSVYHIFCRNPLISTDSYAIRTPIVWHILGACFCLQIWGVGVVRIIYKHNSDFQSEVGEVFGEIGGELPAKFGRRFSSFFCWEKRQKHFPPKLHRKFHHQTSLRGSGWWRALELFSKLVILGRELRH